MQALGLRITQIFLAGFFSKLVDLRLHKVHHLKNKFGIKTTEEYYKQVRNECDDFVLHSVDVTTVDKILKNLDVAKVSGIDQISAKFLKDGAPVIAIHLANSINLLIKLDTFSSKFNIAKIKRELFKQGFKNGIKAEAKNYRPINIQRNELLDTYQSGFKSKSFHRYMFA